MSLRRGQRSREHSHDLADAFGTVHSVRAFSSNSTLGGDDVADEELARATGAGASASVHVADLSAEFTEESHNEQSTRDVAAHFGVDVEQAVGAVTGEMPSGVMPSGDMPGGGMPGGGMPGGGMPESLVHADSWQDTCLSTDAHGATSHLDEEASALHQEARAQEAGAQDAGAQDAGAQEAIPRQGKNPRDIALMISCLVRVALSAVTEFALYTWGVARLMETGISTATAATLGAVFPLGMAIGRLSAGLVIRWRHIFTASIAVSIVGTFIVGVGANLPQLIMGLVLAGIGTALLYPIAVDDVVALPRLSPNRAAALCALGGGTTVFLVPVVLPLVQNYLSVGQSLLLLCPLTFALWLLPNGQPRPWQKLPKADTDQQATASDEDSRASVDADDSQEVPLGASVRS